MKLHRIIKQNRKDCPELINEKTLECITPTKAKQSEDGNDEQVGDDSSNEKQSKGSDGQDSNTEEDEDDEAE
jgi:hypothetical protein